MTITIDTPKLLWLDLETTGLDPTQDQILEVGAIITGFTDLPPWEEAKLYTMMSMPNRIHMVRYIDIDKLRMDKFCREMHEKNGLREACQSKVDGVTLWEMEQRLLDFLRKHDVEHPKRVCDDVGIDKRAWHLAGASVHFDKRFIDHHFPSFKEKLHYRIHDVSSDALFCRSLGMSKPPELKDKPHRTISDLENAMQLMKYCWDWFRSENTKLNATE